MLLCHELWQTPSCSALTTVLRHLAGYYRSATPAGQAGWASKPGGSCVADSNAGSNAGEESLASQDQQRALNGGPGSTRQLAACTASSSGCWHQQCSSHLQSVTVTALSSRAFSSSTVVHVGSSGSSYGATDAAGAASAGAAAHDANYQARAITRMVRDAQRLQQLEQIVQQAGSSFNAIHTAAAFSRAMKLAGDSPEAAEPLLQLLAAAWQAVVHQATARELASVAHACGKLGCTDEQLWSSTVAAFLQQGMQANAQDLGTMAYALAAAAAASKGNVPGMSGPDAAGVLSIIAQQLAVLVSGPAAGDASAVLSITNMLWAHAKLAVPVAQAQLAALLQAMAQPPLLGSAAAQSIASTLWAVSELLQLPDGQVQLQQGVLQQLLGHDQLSKIAQGSPQAVSNTLLALGRLSSGAGHSISVPFAQECAEQLVRGPTAQQLSKWNSQDIGSSMWACAKVGHRDMHFLQSVAAAAPEWLPGASAYVLHQVAWACAKLKYRHPQLMADMMQHGRQLMHGSRSHGVLLPSQADRSGLAATLCWAVSVLNLTQLAGDVKALVAASGIKQQEMSLAAADARTLWRVHSWLLQQHLLGGHGLTRLLTEQQLAACAAASRHTHRHTPPPPAASGTAGQHSSSSTTEGRQ